MGSLHRDSQSSPSMGRNACGHVANRERGESMKHSLALAFIFACAAAWALVYCAAMALFRHEMHGWAVLILLAILGWFWFELRSAEPRG